MKIKFAFSEAKAVEALAFIATEHPGFTPLFVSKVLFFAEKWHINRYGRPIIGDTYIAMPQGPVPSSVKNCIDQNWHWLEEPVGFSDAVSIDRTGRLPRLVPGKRGPNLKMLSDTDIECLREAIAFCASKTAPELSDLTHFESAWRNADMNQPMNYADFVDDDNPHRAEIMEMIQENSAYGVL
ncbi:MAG: SocA family protein [Proteobacteria bacterium]|nr:SocA family protein [Pseudomonadota bacterium]